VALCDTCHRLGDAMPTAFAPAAEELPVPLEEPPQEADEAGPTDEETGRNIYLPMADSGPGAAPLSWARDRPDRKPAPSPRDEASDEAGVGDKRDPAPAPAPATPVGVPLVFHTDEPPRPSRPRIVDARSDKNSEVLNAAANRGLISLHRRIIPEVEVEIDHLVVSPNGLWVVVDQPYPEGRVERRDLGDWFTPEPRLFVGDTDRTQAVRLTTALDRAVGTVLAGTEVASLPRYRVVSFLDAPPGWFDHPFPFEDVWITWSRHLVEPMLATTHLPGPVREEMAQYLEVAFPRA